MTPRPPSHAGQATAAHVPVAPSASVAPASVAQGGGTLREASVTWRLPRTVLGALAPEGASRLVELVVAVHLSGTTPHATVTVRDPARAEGARLLERRESVAVEVIPDIRGEVHVEAPGLLHATLAPQGEGWRVAYARTPVLSALGVPGGRAELAGCFAATAAG